MSELKFKRNEVLTIYRKSTANSSRLPLLNDERTEVCPRLRHILDDSFDIHSSLADPEDPQSRRVMNRDNLRSLISVVTDDDTKENDP